MEMILFEVRNIQKSFRNKKVLKNITFRTSSGQCVGIFGKNGCGKSTLISILAGASVPDAGEIEINGKNPLKHTALFTSDIGYVPQDNPLMETLTVLDNLKLWYPDKKTLNEDLKNGLPARFHLNEIQKTVVRRLSGGMKKRLSIACALAAKPPILLMDEPTAALDLACKNDIRSYLREYMKQGGIVLFTTHEESDLALCTEAWYMEDGVLEPLPVPVTPDAILSRMEERP